VGNQLPFTCVSILMGSRRWGWARACVGKVGDVGAPCWITGHRGRLVVTAAAVVVLGACGGTGTSPPESAVKRPPSVAPTTTSTASPAGQPGEIHQVDVDGDGRLDAVQLRWVTFTDRERGRGTVRLTVHLDSGTTVATNLPVFGWTSRQTEQAALPWFGATRLLGTRGDQLVLGYDDSPAAADGYQVVAYMNGHLMRVPALPDAADPYEWFAHQSVGTGENGFACEGTGVESITVDPAGHMTTDTFRWNGTHWTSVGHHVSHVNGRTTGISDWQHCSGLPAVA